MSKECISERRLGKTNILVHPIGLGGIPIQKLTLEEGIEVITKAITLGVNFIDSARGYTCSEEYIGKALKKRSDVYLATKSMSKKHQQMKDDIVLSLNSFQTEYIDLYQCHNVKSIKEFQDIIAEDGAYKALVEAKRAGLIHYIGITSHSKDFLMWLLNSEYANMFDTIQFPYNFIETDAKELFMLAHHLGIGTIVMKPLAGGVIEDGAIALKYLLNDDSIDVIIPGMGSIEEVKTNLGFTSRVLTNEDNEYINRLREEVKEDFCHRCGYCLPCFKGIDIPTIFTLEKYYTKYGLSSWATTRYQALASSPKNCIDCRECIRRCPYKLDIPKKIKEIIKLMER